MAKATINDVANLAQVSIKTVSRVVNKEANVRPTTRAKVEAAIRQLNYRPNLLAKSLAGSSTRILGLLFGNPSSSYLVAVQRGVLNWCVANQYDLLVRKCEFQGKDVAQQIIDLVEQGRVDGVILLSPMADMPEVCETLEDHKIPFVRIGLAQSGQLHMNTASVSANDREAAYRMTEYLLELGHERIGFILGDPKHGNSQERFTGYKQALAHHGITFDELLVEQGYFTFESGEQAGANLLRRSMPPTAIFASNDDMAAGVIVAVRKHGLSVPENLSVVGFDDTPTAIQMWPQLTTVSQPIADMGAKAAELLYKKLKYPDEAPGKAKIQCVLKLRGTSGRRAN